MSEPSRAHTSESEGTSATVLDWGAALAVHDRWLRRVVASRLGEPQAVDEVMQDVALAAVAQRSPLHNPARVAVWLYRLAVRHVLIYRRKVGRRRGLVDRYAARAALNSLDATPSPLAWRGRAERQKLVRDPLRLPPPRDAELLTLKYTEGFSARELADRLGVAVATVEMRLHRARRRLRAELAGLSAEFEAFDHDTH